MEENIDRSGYIKKVLEILELVKEKSLSEKEKQEKALEIASLIILESKNHKIKKLKKLYSISDSLQNANGKTLIINVIDFLFRIKNTKEAAALIAKQIIRFGIPRSLSFSIRLNFLIFRLFYKRFYNVLFPWAKKIVLGYCSNFVTCAPKEELEKFEYLKKEEKFNIAYVNEEAIGENDVNEYLEDYLTFISNPAVDCLSIKISAISSKIKINAWEYSLDKICQNLRKIYSAAKANSKFINLDMESYKYLHFTVAAFKTVLEEKEFLDFSAGITLQAYLPDSYAIEQNLINFAKERVEKGGAPIKINIVKGSYLSYEQVIASQKGWPQAPFLTKNSTDANFKKMMRLALVKENAKAAHVTISTHNIFDISYALVLRSANEVEPFVDFQILEGRIALTRRVLKSILKEQFRIYFPIINLDQFSNAVYFLQRRLEENIGSDSFLKFVSEITPNTPLWSTFETQFLQSFDEIESISSTPRRSFNSKMPTLEVYEGFENESDTDFNAPSSMMWQKEIIEKWKDQKHAKIPLVIGGNEIYTDEIKFNFCPIYLSPIYSYSVADKKMFDLAITKAKEAEANWESVPLEEKKQYLENAAQIFREKRKDLIGSAMVDVSKTLKEVDHEVSSSIDLLEYYLNRISKLVKMKDVDPKPKGTILIASSRAFPLSTSTGKIISALLTGNTVIFKPSPDTVLSAWHLVNIFWKGGIPKTVLQFVNCCDETFETFLKDERISLLLVSAASDTVDKFLKINPNLNINATSEGKNTIIITAAADRLLAIKNLVKSAFTFSGQKYSSASIAILEEEVYDDPSFMKNLLDATLNLDIGSIYDFHTDVGPLMRKPTGKVLEALTTLEEGEEWLLKPKADPTNPFLWSCGIKLGVKITSLLYKKFLPCPLLGIMKAANLQEAISLANGVEYGLTAGLESLDEEQHILWKKSIEAGTLYINRPIIKAVIRRQPFGGCKRSSFGKNFKVGGPNYLLPCINPKEVELPKERKAVNEKVNKLSSFVESLNFSKEEREIWHCSIENYAFWWQKMSVFRDPIKILGQDNFFGYLPLKVLIFRVNQKDNFLDVFRICAAALTCSCPLELSFDSRHFLINLNKIINLIKVTDESDEQFLQKVEKGLVRRVRVASKPSKELIIAARNKRCFIDDSKVLSNGRYELLNYLRELSISYDYHRFGNLGARESELRKPLL